MPFLGNRAARRPRTAAGPYRQGPGYSCRPSTFSGPAALSAAKRLARTASGRAVRRRARSATSGGRLGGAETGAAGPESAGSAPHSAPPAASGFCKCLLLQGVTSVGSSPWWRTMTIGGRGAQVATFTPVATPRPLPFAPPHPGPWQQVLASRGTCALNGR
jgi:hypothetical protein